MDIKPKDIIATIKLMNEYYSPELIQAMKDFLSSRQTSRNILEAAIPELAILLSHPNIDVRSGILDIFRKLRISKAVTEGVLGLAEAVPALVDRLDKEDKTMQIKIIEILGRLGPGAKEAIPKLTAYTKHKNVNIRNEAFYALRKISPDRIK
jgi:HEAT repeat protein